MGYGMGYQKAEMKKPRKAGLLTTYLAEREGFEPSIRD